MIAGIKSKKRTTENGEILTPEFIVDAMLDQFPDIIDPSKKVLIYFFPPFRQNKRKSS